MTDLYAAVDSCGETVGTFSTLEKAKTVVEAKITDDIRAGYYGHRYTLGPTPTLTWRDVGGIHKCGFVRGGGYFNNPFQWDSCDPVVYTIVLNPEQLP